MHFTDIFSEEHIHHNHHHEHECHPNHGGYQPVPPMKPGCGMPPFNGCNKPHRPHRPHHRPVKMNDYHYYDYADGSSLSTYSDQAKKYFDHKFDMVNGVDIHEMEHALRHALKFYGIEFHNTVSAAKEALIDEIHSLPFNDIATRNDIDKAIERINEHLNDTLDEIDFDGKFEDLNEMIQNLNN